MRSQLLQLERRAPLKRFAVPACETWTHDGAERASAVLRRVADPAPADPERTQVVVLDPWFTLVPAAKAWTQRHRGERRGPEVGRMEAPRLGSRRL